MSKTYQDIIHDLINHLYLRSDQGSKRKILIAYLTQAPRNRRLTLDELGVIGGVTRERARQDLGEFKREFSRKAKEVTDSPFNDLSGGKEYILNLRDSLMRIVSQINLFERPVLGKNIQDGLQKDGILVNHIYLPLVCELAQMFNIDINFKIEDFYDESIIVNLDDERGKYTEGIISYAAKIARHCSGVFSVDKLINSDWNPKAPKSITNIPASLRLNFVIDLLSADSSIMFLQDSSFYAFRERDERISSILVPIFYSYKSPIEKTILINAVQRAIKLRLLQKKDSRQRVFIDVLESSELAIDEYCRRTLFLDVENVHYRISGEKLSEGIKNYQLGDIYKNQYIVLEKIRANGSPVDSFRFGEISAGMPEAQKSHLYSYPILFYKDGEGRRRDLYKTLDGIYSTSENIQDPVSDNSEARAHAIKEKIARLLEELKNLDVSYEETITRRAEQSLLRELLMLLSPKAKMTSNLLASRCQICNKYYPTQLLVAAHVKPRSKCSDDERADIENIAMLQCKSCDSLYEHGYLSVDENGIVIAANRLAVTDDLKILLSQIAGNSCDYVNGNQNRLSYLKFHREHIFNN